MVELKTVAVGATLFLILFNAGPAALMASGVAADWGIEPAVSGDETIDQANEDLRNIEASGGFGDTLFGLYTTVTEPVRGLLNIVLAGPTMLQSVGVPTWLTAFMFAPAYMIVGGAIVYVLAGRLL